MQISPTVREERKLMVYHDGEGDTNFFRPRRSSWILLRAAKEGKLVVYHDGEGNPKSSERSKRKRSRFSNEQRRRMDVVYHGIAM
jgi:hypothetical protein